MTINTLLRELRDTVVCAITSDTYQGHQENTTTHQPSKPRGGACDSFAHARIMKNHADYPHLSPAFGHWLLAQTEELVAILES